MIIEKTLDNLKYCRNFYEGVFDDVSYFFHKKIKELADEFVEKTEDDLSNGIYYTKKLKEVDSHIEVLKIFNRFFFKTGRFPGNHNDLMIVPAGVKPSFVKTRDEVSPFEINEKLQSGPSYGLAATQFLAAMNIYFSGDERIPENVMSAFFHNLSLQALSIDDDSIKNEFDAIITLSKNLKILIRDDTRNDLNIIDFQQQKFDEIKDKNQLIEEEVVNNIINDVQIDYPQVNQHLTIPNTASEITMQSEANDIIEQKAFEAFNKRDGEISQELITNARNDLIKSAIDAEGEIPADVFNNITSSFQLAEEDKTERSVREHVQSTIKKTTSNI